MKITLNGQKCKRVSELKVGEWGYVPTCVVGAGVPEPGVKTWPIMTPPMGDCYRVTKPADGEMCLEFVSAVQAARKSEEYLVVETASHMFHNTVVSLQNDGWCVGSITVTPDSDGGFSYVALLRRGESNEQ